MAGKAGALFGKDLECHFDICSADNEELVKVFEYESYMVTVVLESHTRVQMDWRKERWGVVKRLLQ